MLTNVFEKFCLPLPESIDKPTKAAGPSNSPNLQDDIIRIPLIKRKKHNRPTTAAFR